MRKICAHADFLVRSLLHPDIFSFNFIFLYKKADIWGGNTAVWVDGARAQVTVDSCVLQSDTGRGIVVTNQAELQMFRSSIANCAATGFYLGDWGSRET